MEGLWKSFLVVFFFHVGPPNQLISEHYQSSKGKERRFSAEGLEVALWGQQGWGEPWGWWKTHENKDGSVYSR